MFIGHKKNLQAVGLTLLLFVVHTYHLSAQKNVKLINSLDLLKQGVVLYDSGSYDKACGLYEQISRNDTNYVLALYEEGLSYEANHKDSMAIILCNKGLEIPSDYLPDFYKLKAGALIDMQKYDEAVNLIRQAITKYPNVYLLHFTLGLAHYGAGDYDSAVAAFERSINLNFFHASSHYYLGECCLKQGRIIPALLSLQFSLVLEPLTTRSFSIVQLIEKVVENKYDFSKITKADPAKYGDQPFSDLELLVTSQVALNKGYKSETKITYNLVKQCQLIYEKLTYQPNTNNFWMNNYVPFFNDMRKKDFFGPYSYYIMQSVSDDALQQSIKKEKKKIDAYVSWADNEILAMRHTKQMAVNGKPVTVTCYYYNSHMLQAAGPEDAKGKQVGEWTIYHENNGLVAAKGAFDENSNRIGTWEWFYTNGTLKERTNYVAGKKNGLSETWYENGAPKVKYNYKDDLLDGEAYDYNVSGMASTFGSYIQGKPMGKFTLCYADGKPHYIVNYGEPGLDGEQREYYVTGQVKLSTVYKNGKKNGTMTEYWPNGKTKDQGEYQDDKCIGHYKFYYEDGLLQKEADYTNGEPSGTVTLYYPNGKKEEETAFGTGGKMDGADITYDDDGIKYGELFYQKDALQHYTYYDKQGKIISEGKLSGKKLHHENYYANGVKHSEGESVDNLREGVWKFYTSSGALVTTETYQNGRLEGTAINYYLNGQIKDQVDYKNDATDGYYKEYYHNGTMKSEGWYVAGQEQGDWYYYDARGGVESHSYYLNGNVNGYVDYYNPTGKLSEEDSYRLGYLDKAWIYDTTGKNVVYAYISDKGNGHYTSVYPDMKMKTDRFYIAGMEDGHEKRYYYNGKLVSEGDYLLDKHEGVYKTYFDNGNPETVSTYINGELTGLQETYFKSGKIKYEDNYLANEENGPFKEYYEAGNLRREGADAYGFIEGKYTYYSTDSLIYCLRWYHNGMLTGYSYLSKNGLPAPIIPFKNGTGSVKSYYANGNKSLECSYNYNTLDGKRKEYFSNGNIYQDENYDMGDLSGLQKYYYSSGKLKAEENYYLGSKDGKSIFYFENGKTEHEENWVLGYKQGTFKYYNNTGKLIKTVVYYNNDEICESTL